MNATLVLEDASVYEGFSIGVEGITSGEVVFNTAMTGYQEIMTDPSYAGQIVTFTSPHIGNVGVNNIDIESSKVHLKGMVVRTCSEFSGHWLSQSALPDYLKSQKIVGIAGIDTRALTHKLRTAGALQGCIMSGEINVAQALAHIEESRKGYAQDLAMALSTALPYVWREEAYGIKKYAETYNVVVVDFGVKQSILTQLVDLGCKVTVLPAKTSIEAIKALNPDGILLSNGPGDPEKCLQAIKLIRNLCEYDFPIFGICLGMQLLALALGAATVKLKFGHHGANHPVLDLKTGHIMITSQNHNYVVAETTLSKFLQITHRSLFDRTIQGFKHITKAIYGFQGHPEAGPGPHDGGSLFTSFISAMKAKQLNQKVDTACQSA